MKQCPNETLCKYIQRFSQVRNKITCASDEGIISAFSNGVMDVRMCEKLSINDNLSSALDLSI